MKIDFRQPMRQLNGDTVKGADKKDVTLADVAIIALDGQKEDRFDPKEKFRRGELQDRIFRAKEGVEISIDEAALIKEAIGAAYGTRVVFQAWQMLEGKDRPQPKPSIPGKK